MHRESYHIQYRPVYHASNALHTLSWPGCRSRHWCRYHRPTPSPEYWWRRRWRWRPAMMSPAPYSSARCGSSPCMRRCGCRTGSLPSPAAAPCTWATASPPAGSRRCPHRRWCSRTLSGIPWGSCWPSGEEGGSSRWTAACLQGQVVTLLPLTETESAYVFQFYPMASSWVW